MPDDSASVAARDLDRQRLARAWELAELANDLMERSTGTGILQGRLDRLQDLNDRRLERERRRAEGGVYAGERRSPNIPTHVEPSNEAWNAIKKDVALPVRDTAGTRSARASLMTRLWSASTALGAGLDRGLAARAPLTMFDETYLGMDASTQRLFQE